MKNVIHYVAFCPKKDKHWWAKTYSHVTPFQFSDGIWSVTDLQNGDFVTQHFWRQVDIEDMISFMLHHYTVLKVGDKGQANHYFRPMTCVAFTKQLIGSSSRAFLPDQLFRNLVENGAEILNETEGTRGDS